MPRPAPWRLLPASYPTTETMQTRFQDLDPMGHLNNVAFAALFENARVRFNQRMGSMNRERGFRGVVAQSTINYIAEGSYPEDVEIATGIGAIGNRSWEILAAMFQSGKIIATCDTVIVMTSSPGEPLPTAFRHRLEELRVREG
ncbi:acyl-CoA thioesterase [Sphingomonas sp. SUN019]|uniref:acyl-CoA thioesterase n=1 Tax=Sphingomonas sp. SUN019 TaxID=2937788 RepID=UPI002164D611|nr:acyl-CoA thioesterase [Sphingomonas sp. SUN019]UVO50421.1 acyl-CoA thioesterase [Sphingomonas sp. SUN019]